jgi:hypothetical protein
VFLELHQRTIDAEDAEGDDESAEDPLPPAPPPEPDAPIRPQASEHTVAYLGDPFEDIARLSGEPDHDTWWEKHFEHAGTPAAYSEAIDVFGSELRGLRDPNDAENLLREAYMRRCIRQVLAEGHKPEKVLVVCGAFHTAALIHELPAMTDAEEKKLPRVEHSLTLMPYSYRRLASQSGYGAGNHAPAFFERIYKHHVEGTLAELPARYLTEVCHILRKEDQMRSAAEVIEAVRLSTNLAVLRGGSAPTLADLHDAAITLLGRADPLVVKNAFEQVDVGNRVGKLPKGILRTSIQDDFYANADELYLSRYLKDSPENLELDLRADRYVKSEAAAYRDLNRSIFLHRLLVLGVKFAEKMRAKQDDATWKEVWQLRWTPNCEIELVEAGLTGDSVEIAAAVALSEELARGTRIDEAAEVVRRAAECDLADALENARRRLQVLAVEENGFVPVAGTVHQLAETIRYGSVRRLDSDSLKPLVTQLFLRCCLVVRDACNCDDEAARAIIAPAIVKASDVAGDLSEVVDAPRWKAAMRQVAELDNVNPYLSGYVTSLNLPEFDDEWLELQVSRRLSRGVPPDLGAAWFEGLVQYNRAALFLRTGLWRAIDHYVTGLDKEEFRAALVPLRRAFGNFSVGEVRRVVSTLADLSKDGAAELAAVGETPLSDEEAKDLGELLGDLGDLGI